MLKRTLRTALAATTILTGGIALAANEPPAPANHTALMTDLGKLSADGSRAYQDVKLTRLAIYDGRIADAKKYAAQADAAFEKAKTDDSVFTKAEANMRTHTGPAASGQTSHVEPTAAPAYAKPQSAAATPDVAKPIAWLPVDSAVSLNEDFSAEPAKVKAVAEANKSLAQGDRKGAMDKLKLADVGVDVVTAVVPVQQTLSEVRDAAHLIDSGKYYEGSQKLRAVQESAIFLVSDMTATPKPESAKAGGQADHPAPAPSATAQTSGAAKK